VVREETEVTDLLEWVASSQTEELLEGGATVTTRTNLRSTMYNFRAGPTYGMAVGKRFGLQVGAGLQESRLNTDLIAWLERWGSWILTGVLVVVLAYVGWTRYGQWQANQRDEAYAAWVAARGDEGPDGVLTGNPDGLLRVASEHEGEGAVAMLARLDAAEILLVSGTRGLRPGADAPDPAEEDVLSAEEQREMLGTARDLFRRVSDSARAAEGRGPLEVRALFGLASASASLGERDAAEAAYERLIALSGRLDLPDVEAWARADLELLRGSWEERVAFVPREALPAENIRPEPTQNNQGMFPVRMGEDGAMERIDPSELPGGGEPAGGGDGAGGAAGDEGSGERPSGSCAAPATRTAGGRS